MLYVNFRCQKSPITSTNDRPRRFLCGHTISPSEINTWLGVSDASSEMRPALPQWEQTAISSPQALNWRSHGLILSDGYTKGPDWLVLEQSTTNHLPIGQTQKDPFPTGMSNNTESNIQVTHPARERSFSVCGGAGAPSFAHNPCVWCGIMTHVLLVFDPEFWSQVNT